MNIFPTSWKYFSDLLQIETALPEIETACGKSSWTLGHNFDFWQGSLNF